MKRFVVWLVLAYVIPTGVFGMTGGIDTTQTPNQAKVCYDVTCTTPTPSILNFALDQEPSIVIDSVDGISGKVWGSKLGWVTMNPEGAGVVFANTATGVLTGRAWSQVAGWINFAPTGQQVRINPATGEFEGWAWAGGPYGGWIKFDCADAGACVRTTWKIASTSSGGVRGGMTIKAAPVVDVCANIEGVQDVPPLGTSRDITGACVPLAIDYCPNIGGAQTTVPKGMMVTSAGSCTPYPKDVCPQDAGVQTSYDQCKKRELDSCMNIAGIQVSIPEGYEQSGDSCYPITVDFCPNIDGAQASIPSGLTMGADGTCILSVLDVCPNIAGIQDTLPENVVKRGEDCVFAGMPVDPGATPPTPQVSVVAFSFVPEELQVPTGSAFVRNLLNGVDKVRGVTRTTTDHRVDVVSVGILGAVVALAIGIVSTVVGYIRRRLV